MPNHIYKDIGFTPEYSELFKDTAFGGEPCVFESSGIEYRFYKRPIEGTPYCDIVSPYGYSGPVRIHYYELNQTADDYDYLSAFHKFCIKENIVAEFARLHPFLENHRSLEPESVVQSGEVYYVDFTKPFEFDKGCKSAIRKAEKAGCMFYLSENSYDWTDFEKRYAFTMGRDGASNKYLFTPSFWARLETMSEAHLFGVQFQKKTIAGCVILTYGDYAHYFLAAAERNSGAGNFVLFEAISWAKEAGYKIFNLGGGVHPNDSLASFKRSFSRLSKPFFTYRKTHNQAVYNQLCQAKGVDPDSEGFFPAYRR